VAKERKARNIEKTVFFAGLVLSGGCYNHSSSLKLRKTVHILFTPALLAPASGLEIRNRFEMRQEKT